MEEHYLELSENPIRFDAVSQLTNVFYDDTNGQVFAVRSSGVTGVIVKGPDPNLCTTFLMEDKGRVISIKFSPDLGILAIQRSHTSVDFINFTNLVPSNTEYSQTCKWKNGSILGFCWIKPNEIAFITDHGIELLQVLPEKKQLKSLKAVKISSTWFAWCAKSKLALLACSNGLYLQPFTFNNSSINKLPRVEMEGPVNDSDVSCARLYESSWCLVLRHGGKCPAEVLAIPLDSSINGAQTHALRTGLVGRFAINVVDDLIVVHHQASQTSMLFDIMEEGTIEGDLKVHAPIAPPKSLKAVSVPDLPYHMYSGNWVVFQPDVVIDARLGCLWRVILKPGGLTNIHLHKTVRVLLRRTEGRTPIFAILKHMISDATKHLIELMKVFDQINAVYRKQAEIDLVKQTGQNSSQNDTSSNNARDHIVYHRVVITQQDIYTNVLQQYTDSPHIIQRSVTGDENWILYENIQRIRSRTKGTEALTVAKPGLHPKKVLLCIWWDWKGVVYYEPLQQGETINSTKYCFQLDNLRDAMQSTETQLTVEKDYLKKRSFHPVVLNYICSLARHQVSPQHALTEMLVRALVRANRFSDLHQLLQYGAVGDSKPLACLLLSLANLHPAAHQLALDMLHRLKAYEETVEVLLGEGEVVTGVAVAKQYSPGCQQVTGQNQFGSLDVWNSLRARKLLSAAQHDVNAFISVYHALENRNRINRNSQSFIKGEQCDSYVQLYMTLFPDEIER